MNSILLNKFVSNKKVVINSLITLVLIVGFVSGVILIRQKQNTLGKAATSLVNLSLAPQSLTMTINSTQTIGLFVDTQSNQMSAANIELTFDPNLIQIDSATVENILPVQIVPLTVNNGVATLTLAAACQETTCNTFNGAGYLARFNVRTLGVATPAQLTFTGNTIVTATGAPANMVGSKTGTTINISSTEIDTEAPAVSITAPSQGVILERRSNITLTASASDNVAVASVEFYVNGSRVCTVNTSPYACNYNLSGKPRATYAIYAVAKDSSNNSTTSPTVTITTN